MRVSLRVVMILGVVMIVGMVMVMSVIIMMVMMAVRMIMIMVMAVVIMVMAVIMVVVMVVPVIMLMACSRLQRRWHGVAVQRREDEAVLSAEILVSARPVAIPLARTIFRRAADALHMVVV
ncbi:MAG TPA: hypothetical protein VLQ68_11590, partial [Rhizobiaceae bacterium]|nr:hypothetical protein [Rhizobiaceae bacterium]